MLDRMERLVRIGGVVHGGGVDPAAGVSRKSERGGRIGGSSAWAPPTPRGWQRGPHRVLGGGLVVVVVVMVVVVGRGGGHMAPPAAAAGGLRPAHGRTQLINLVTLVLWGSQERVDKGGERSGGSTEGACA